MKKINYLWIIMLSVIGLTINVQAQINPLTMQYYNYRYLGNAAYAGIDTGLTLGLNYRKQWTNIPGAPEVQNLTIDYGKKRTGIGLNINLDKAGLQKLTRVVGSYAYHVPLSGKANKLSFGVSLGMMNQRISNHEIIGNINDELVSRYNQRETYVDGDFGVVYQLGGFNIEAALPNLNFLFRRSVLQTADVPTFYAATSYVIFLKDQTTGMSLEPRLVYRGVKGFDNLIDVGLNFAIQKNQLMLMYHSNESFSLGANVALKQRYSLGASYTSQTSQLNNYMNGSFELNLKLSL